jgi:F0F1-type ATP synthase assembly protein I
MFCPRCAAQNLDDAKFCRACGINLENVALALADKYRPAKKKGKKAQSPLETALEMRKESVNKLVKGIGLSLSSLVIGVALGLFSNTNDWIIIWMCLVGWMACWGIISLVSGTAGLMESRTLRRELGESDFAPSGVERSRADDSARINDALAPPVLPPHSSVTENTTTRLVKPEATTKQVT